MVVKGLVITYCFAVGFDYTQTIRESSHYGSGTTSSATVADWFSASREICTIALANRYENSGPMSGPNSIIEIDEMKLGRTKYHVRILFRSKIYFSAADTSKGVGYSA